MKNMRVNGFRRIDKRKAKRLYLDGVVIYIMANKMRIDNQWTQPCALEYNKSVGDQFQTMCDNYKFYNCTSETGRDIWYYVKE